MSDIPSSYISRDRDQAKKDIVNDDTLSTTATKLKMKSNDGKELTNNDLSDNSLLMEHPYSTTLPKLNQQITSTNQNINPNLQLNYQPPRSETLPQIAQKTYGHSDDVQVYHSPPNNPEYSPSNRYRPESASNLTTDAELMYLDDDITERVQIIDQRGWLNSKEPNITPSFESDVQFSDTPTG